MVWLRAVRLLAICSSKILVPHTEQVLNKENDLNKVGVSSHCPG
uniref:Uncharacterized protein n=1 Tax=Anguilla anguilla TaxID=7936 RepID=A0A0E9R7B9_ANGAN